jgi:hypothetical protein
MAIRANAQPPRRQGNWQNKVLARVVVEALGYNPSKHFKAIKAPVFFRLALKDHLCPPEILHAALERAGLPEVRRAEVVNGGEVYAQAAMLEGDCGRNRGQQKANGQ